MKRAWLVGVALLAGCSDGTEIRDEDLRVTQAILEPVTRAGYAVNVEVVPGADALTARVEAARSSPGPRASVLVVSPARVAFVANAALDGVLPRPDADALVERWTAPFLAMSDLRGVPKAFGHGLLVTLAQRGLVKRDAPFVPFLPPERPHEYPSRAPARGLLVALAVFVAGALLGRGRR